MHRTFGILGGDGRFGTVADLLSAEGNAVRVWGLNRKTDIGRANYVEHLVEAVESSDVIVLPIPALSAEGLLNIPFSEEKIDIADVLKMMSKGSVLAGGLLPLWLTEMAESRNVSVIDYGRREDFIVANAVPTAEGAIGIALRELKRTLWDSNCMVLGFGRIGKILAQRLSTLCRNLTVVARKPLDISMARAFGYEAENYQDWRNQLRQADVIFNTVPFEVLSADALDDVKASALIVDLASKPGGTDFKAAESKGIKTVWALSLPGKCAPQSAGRIIAESICNSLYEME